MSAMIMSDSLQQTTLRTDIEAMLFESNSHSPISTQSQFRTAAQSGEFLITAEVAPPKGGNPGHMIQMAQTLKGRVHAVNITDGSRAVMRMSSLVASALLLQNGIEPICQVACRDR